MYVYTLHSVYTWFKYIYYIVSVTWKGWSKLEKVGPKLEKVGLKLEKVGPKLEKMGPKLEKWVQNLKNGSKNSFFSS